FHTAIRQIRRESQVRSRLEHGHRLLVDVLVTNAVRERVDSGAHEPLRVVHVEDVRRNPQPAIVRFVDDGGILCGSYLLDLTPALVDPDFDDVRPVRSVLLNRPASFHLAVDLERRTARFDSGDALSGAKVARGTGDELIAHTEKFKAVQAKTQCGADAEISTLFQVPDERVASRVEMGVRVHDHRHHGFAGKIYASCAFRHAYVSSTAN